MMAALDQSLRIGVAPPRLAALPAIRVNRAALAAVALALLLHICVVSALVIIGPGAPPAAPPAPTTLLVNVVTPEAAPDDPAADIIEPVLAIEPEPAPVETRIEPAPAVASASRDTPARTTTADTASEAADPPVAPASGPVSVMTAEGGHSDMPQYAAREGSALRGLFCATGSREMRVAAGCDMLGEGGFAGLGDYADSEAAGRIAQAFYPVDVDPGGRVSTVHPTQVRLPGQVFSQQSHFLRGAHTAFGQLPVPEKARDPGFGD